jgi:hypothetical protein
VSIDDIVAEITKEWSVIRAAPVLSIAVLIVVAIGIWAIVNWGFSSVLSNKNSQIDLLNSQIGSYKDTLNGATPDQVKARIESLEQKISLLSPRLLTEDQKRIVAEQAILPQGVSCTIDISTEGGCVDCNRYAAGFSSTFSRVPNWIVRTPMVMGLSKADASGVTVFIKDVAHPTIQDAALLRALQMAQIKYGIFQRSSRDVDIELQINTKSD